MGFKVRMYLVYLKPGPLMLGPDDEVRRYLVQLEYWTLNLRPLMVYPEVLFPLNFIIKAAGTDTL